MDIIFWFFWVIGAFIVSLFGTDKKLGYWGIFVISIILSPIIGILAIILSPRKITEREIQAQKFRDYLESADRAAFRGDINEAIRNYKDALFYLGNPSDTKSKTLSKYRTQRWREIQAKIEALENINTQPQQS